MDSEGNFVWDDQVSTAYWDLLVTKPGYFTVELTYAADNTAAGGTAQIEIAGREIVFHVRDTGGWDNFVTDPTKIVLIRRGQQYRLQIQTGEMPGTRLMKLKSVSLKRSAASRQLE